VREAIAFGTSLVWDDVRALLLSREAAAAPARDVVLADGATTCSTIEFQALQKGHLPKY
jgi:hypothetical protein